MTGRERRPMSGWERCSTGIETLGDVSIIPLPSGLWMGIHDGESSGPFDDRSGAVEWAEGRQPIPPPPKLSPEAAAKLAESLGVPVVPTETIAESTEEEIYRLRKERDKYHDLHTANESKIDELRQLVEQLRDQRDRYAGRLAHARHRLRDIHSHVEDDMQDWVNEDD